MPEKLLDGDCTAVDVWVGNSAVDVIDTGGWVASQSLAGLPDLAGYGTVRSLRQAMARDVTGELTIATRAACSKVFRLHAHE